MGEDRDARMTDDNVVITKVAINGSLDYLPRIQKIAACIAESIGLNSLEISEVSSALSHACKNAICPDVQTEERSGMLVTFTSSARFLTTQINDTLNFIIGADQSEDELTADKSAHMNTAGV